MKKPSKAPLIISYVLVIAMMLAAVGLLIGQAAFSGWVFESENVIKFGIVILGLMITLVRLISKTGGGRSLRKYEAAYRKHIGEAFSRAGKKKQKNALLHTIKSYSEGRCSAAVSQLESLLKECDTKDDHAAVLLFLALSYEQMEMIDDAIASYEKLLKYSPERSTAWSNLGILYRQQGKTEKSISCIESALKCDQNNAHAWNNLAQAYLAAGSFDKVIAPAHRALSIKADMYQADTALAVAYFALDDKEKSKQHFDSAVLHGANAANLTSILNGMTYGNISFADTTEIDEKVTRAMGYLSRDTVVPMVEVHLPAPNDGNRSRLGGAPVESHVPLDSKGKPMKLLAAIWCSEVRGIPEFPSNGVLRFYIADNELYGADFDRPTLQSDFRVLFDENEDGFNTELCDDPGVSESFPIQHALPLRLKPAMSSVRTTDYRFDRLLNEALTKAGVEGGIEGISERELDFICEQNVYAGHRIGGYPCFEQYDPREELSLEKYDTLLLQIVSHIHPNGNGGEDTLIMFGDHGGCQFFIPKDKLIARDFSDIMFWWDCG